MKFVDDDDDDDDLHKVHRRYLEMSPVGPTLALRTSNYVIANYSLKFFTTYSRVESALCGLFSDGACLVYIGLHYQITLIE